MASTDAKPVPQKNVAYRVTFPIMDADGDLVAGATGLDSEISQDGGTFADCTNEATEIATSSGVYYLDLTSTEMNADTVAIIVKTSSSGAKTTTLVMYPEEAGDIRVNVTQFGGTNGAFSSGRPEVNTTHAAGTAWASGAITAAVFAADAITAATVASDVGTEIGTAVWATTTRQLTGTQSFNLTGSITGSLSGSVGSVTGNVGGTVNGLTATAQGNVRTAIGLASANLDTQLSTIDGNVDSILVDTAEIGTAGAGLTAIPWNSAWDAEVQSEVTDALNAYDPPTNAELAAEIDAVQADIAALENLSAAQVNAEMVDVLTTDTYAEPGQGTPAATASLKDKIGYLYKAWRNKLTQTDSQYALYADDGTTVDQKATTADDGTTFSRTGITGGP